MTTALTPIASPALPSVAVLAAIPEEELWLQGQLSVHTRRAYKEGAVAVFRENCTLSTLLVSPTCVLPMG